MGEEEAQARALAQRLLAAGARAVAEGAGVHWAVEVRGRDDRSVSVSCFWYAAAVHGLMLGMNPANARRRLGREGRAPYEGPEFFVRLKVANENVADGRTYDIAQAAAAAQAWTDGKSLEALARDLPFIDARARAARALAARVPSSLRFDVGGDPSFEVWVYGERRACKLIAEASGATCFFHLGQAQVARSKGTDVAVACTAWLLDRLPLRALQARIGGLELEPHAEVLEVDPARWHWLHLLGRVANPDDVLFPVRELVALLAKSPVATRFFSFSSLSALCFSASSHYPWVDDGLPVVWPMKGRRLVVVTRGTEPSGTPALDLVGARDRVESMLNDSPLEPFFGDADDLACRELDEALRTSGSSLRPELLPYPGGWNRVLVREGSGPRRCVLRSSAQPAISLEAIDGERTVNVTLRGVEEAVVVLRRFLEEGAGIEGIADPFRAE